MDEEKMEKTGERTGKKRKGDSPQGSRVTNERSKDEGVEKICVFDLVVQNILKLGTRRQTGRIEKYPGV